MDSSVDLSKIELESVGDRSASWEGITTGDESCALENSDVQKKADLRRPIVITNFLSFPVIFKCFFLFRASTLRVPEKMVVSGDLSASNLRDT